MTINNSCSEVSNEAENHPTKPAKRLVAHLHCQLDLDGRWRLKRLACSGVTAPDKEVKGYWH